MARNSETVRLAVKLKDEASTGLKRLKNTIAGIGSAVFSLQGAVAGVGIGVLVDRMLAAVDTAGDLNESMSKVQTLFGYDRAREISLWADTAAFGMGLASQAALDAVGSIGNMFLQLKAGPDQAAELGTSLVQLSSDLASFHNAAGGTTSVLDAMQSAFRGEYDALQRYIPTISAAAVQEQALADTRKRSAKDLTALDKALAAHEIILRDAGAAVGDFNRTSHEYANTTRRLDSAWTDFAATLGQRFLPAATRVKDVTAKILKNLTEALSTADLEEQIAAAQAEYDRLLLERDQKEAVLAQKRRAREERHQKMVERFMRRNAGPLNSESQQALEAFQKKQEELLKTPAIDLDIQLAKEKLERLIAMRDKLKTGTQGTGDGKDDGKDDGKTKVLSDDARLKSEILRLQAITETGLAELEQIYEQGMVSVEDYFSQRTTAIEKQYDAEIAALQKLAAAETDPDKRLAIEDEIFSLQEERKRELINLTREETRAYEDLHEAQQRIAEEQLRRRDEAQQAADKKAADQADVGDILGDLSGRVDRAFRGDTLDGIFDEELREMDARHAEEIQRLKDLNATKEQIDEAYRLQKIEKDRLMVDQEKRLHQSRLTNAQQIAQGLSDIFENLYELTGKKHKEFFYLAKAAAIAEATMNIAQGITKAIAQGGWWGYLQAGILSAAGAVQLATITAQTLAAGGRVKGHSPSDTADNVPIWATAGEFMQPVAAVKYYGMEVMEALRKRMIPREFFKGVRLPTPTMNTSFAMAAGGSVPAAPMGSEEKQPINIFNIPDASLMDRYMSSAAGQNAVVNAISARQRRVRRILA